MKKLVSRRDVLLGSAVVVATGCGTSPNHGAPSASGDAAPPLEDAGAPIEASVIDAGAADGSALDAAIENDSSAPTDSAIEPVVGGPGLVVEVLNTGAVVDGAIVDGPVGEIMSLGMRALTGRATEEEAWKALFVADDIVGIKVNPVGYPEVFSQFATLRAIIRGLNLAGVTSDRIIVFDRYKDYLDSVGYPAQLPQGVRFASVVATYDDLQTDTNGYDANEFVDLPRVAPGADATDPKNRRSCLCQLVSQQVTKVINVPALKDHPSAGLTMALKNMTYGFVNNVARTHYAPDNWTKDFLPAIAAMTKIRAKVVLHIADALVGCYAGGPGPVDSLFKTFVYSSLLFSTDPVALDRIGLTILDAQRVSMGLPPVEECGLKLTNVGGESFDERQPQYIDAAGALGLGVADLQSIKHVMLTV